MKNNALIAEFMGAKPGAIEGSYEYEYNYYPTRGLVFVSAMQYHCKWDWLMFVVEKIEGLGYAVEICQNDVDVIEHESKSNLIRFIRISGSNKLDTVYKVVIKFIKWYNKELVDREKEN